MIINNINDQIDTTIAFPFFKNLIINFGYFYLVISLFIIVGSAEVQAIFKVSKIGKVAGSKVTDGEISNNLNARLIRDGNVLYTGSIGSIFREKNAAKQVSAGLECGITLKDFADFKEKDVIEVYKIIETERRI